jgi:uncharacterized protein YkwD
MAYRVRPMVIICSVVAAVLLGPASALAAGTSGTASLDATVLAQLNQVRISHGLTPLALSQQLNAAAREHSRDMIANGYFAHTSSDGSPFWKRIQQLYGSTHDSTWSVGENLFWSSGPPNATTALDAWMASPEHRANILNPTWRQIGIGATSSPDAPGSFDNLAVTVITTDFGARS